MNRKQGPRATGMRPAVNAPQGDSDPLRAKARVESYDAGHRQEIGKCAMEVMEVTA